MEATIKWIVGRKDGDGLISRENWVDFIKYLFQLLLYAATI